MRLILVGSPRTRARLRSQFDDSMQIAGEFATLAEARAADVEADAFVLGASTESNPSRDPHDPKASDDVEALTAREIEVLELLAEGLPNKAIAGRLGISDQTVKFHVASITGKLGAANRTDAVRRAVRRGLITL